MSVNARFFLLSLIASIFLIQSCITDCCGPCGLSYESTEFQKQRISIEDSDGKSLIDESRPDGFKPEDISITSFSGYEVRSYILPSRYISTYLLGELTPLDENESAFKALDSLGFYLKLSENVTDTLVMYLDYCRITGYTLNGDELPSLGYEIYITK